jgi:hypothetical protein
MSESDTDTSHGKDFQVIQEKDFDLFPIPQTDEGVGMFYRDS